MSPQRAAPKTPIAVCATIVALVGCQVALPESPPSASGSLRRAQLEGDWVPLSSSVTVPQDALPDDEPYDNLYRRFSLGFGGLVLAEFDTSMQVGSSSAGVGAVLDLEDSLGVDSKSSSARLDTQYAFNRRSSLLFSIYDIERSGSRVLEDDIEFGDKIIPAGPVDTTFDTQVVKLSYRHNLVADARTVIAVSAGFHVMGIDTGLESDSFGIAEDLRVTVPLPVLGVHAAYALNHKWKVSASIELFRVSIEDFSGSLTDSVIRIDHDSFEHFGWGLGLNSFQMNLGIDDGDVFAEIEYGYVGLMLYLRTFF